MRDLVRVSQKSFFFIVFFALFWSACAPSCNEKKETVEPTSRKAAAKKDTLVDGERAIAHIRKIIAFGPRHAGTIGAEKTRKYILSYLEGLALSPKRHDFTALTPHPDLKSVEMANITVDIDGPGEKKLLIGGHFDGKILKGIQFFGANDGGSSTALLLELARVLVSSPPPCPVRLAFLDGEEALVTWGDADSLYGSKHMAAELRESGEDKSFAAVVIVDMIGDKRLRLNRDRTSSPRVLGTIAKTAKRLGYDTLFKGPRNYIADDHIPFKLIGIPSAVLIDLNFGPGWTSNAYWHTEKDTIDKLSTLSFETVGEVLLESLAELSKL